MTSNNMRTLIGDDGKIHVVAYARVWEDDLEQDPQAQFDLIRNWAEKNNAVIEKEYADRCEGTKYGSEVLDEAIGHVCRHTNISRIVMVEIGRLCRNYSQYHKLIGLMTSIGTETIFLSRLTPADRDPVIMGMDVIMAEFEYRCYRRYGAKPTLGQITFRQYLDTLEAMNARRSIDGE